jgi:hypothetical protein
MRRVSGSKKTENRIVKKEIQQAALLATKDSLAIARLDNGTIGSRSLPNTLNVLHTYKKLDNK